MLDLFLASPLDIRDIDTVLMGKTLAYELIAIADAYPAATARKLGMEKAYALFAYAEATPAGPRRGGNAMLTLLTFVEAIAQSSARSRASRRASRRSRDISRQGIRAASQYSATVR